MAEFNLFDQTLKVIARNHADIFLQLAFPGLPVTLKGTPENVELALPVQPVDFVHRVLYAEQEHIMHLEFQLKHFQDFPRRLYTYHGALTQQFKLPVLSVALYLEYRRAPIPNEYVVKLGETIVNRFTYPVIKLWDYVEEIASGRYRELAPLLVMLVDKPDVQVLERERALILAEDDPEKRADLLALAYAVAARSFNKDFLRSIFRRELQQMQEATLLDEWIEERVKVRVEQRLDQVAQQAAQQALQQGLQQGLLVKQRGAILRLLTMRFELGEEQRETIQESLETITDLPQLEALFDEAVRAYRWEDFHEALQRVIQLIQKRP